LTPQAKVACGILERGRASKDVTVEERDETLPALAKSQRRCQNEGAKIVDVDGERTLAQAK
jgi:hypothetical protein